MRSPADAERVDLQDKFSYVKFVSSNLEDLTREISFVSHSNFEGLSTNFLHMIDLTHTMQSQQTYSISVMDLPLF